MSAKGWSILGTIFKILLIIIFLPLAVIYFMSKRNGPDLGA